MSFVKTEDFEVSVALKLNRTMAALLIILKMNVKSQHVSLTAH